MNPHRTAVVVALLLAILAGPQWAADRQVVNPKDFKPHGRPYSPAIRAGNTLYISGQLGVDEQFPALRAAARYNQGNAFFRQNKWKEAVEAYKDSLRANPRDEDAKYNLGVALNTLRNPPKPQPKSGSGKNDKNQKGSGSKGGAKPSDMSQQDAERLLAAAAASEQKKKAQAPKSGVPKPDEDW